MVTSVWHIRAPYFFAPYCLFGMRLSFAPAFHRGPWPRMLLSELRGMRRMRADRRSALAAMRLPSGS